MIVAAVVCFVLTALCAFISIRQFNGKGFLFNNAYLWASKAEREKMDKKPYYRQSAVTFGLLGAVFLVIGLSAAFDSRVMLWITLPLIIATVIYAAASEIRIGKHEH